jgi:hypothetical protein
MTLLLGGELGLCRLGLGGFISEEFARRLHPGALAEGGPPGRPRSAAATGRPADPKAAETTP